MLTSGMFRLAELQILRNLLQISRVNVKIDGTVSVMPYESTYLIVRNIVFQHHPIPFKVSSVAKDVLDCFPKIKFMDTAEKIRKMSSLTIEYRDYYMNWIRRVQ